jgi:hypothetical protein
MAVEEPAELATIAPKRGIKRESFQDWFYGSKVVRTDGSPLPVYHAPPTIADLQPKSYGAAGEHSYFYFALSKAWARNFAREERGGRCFIRRFYLAIKNPLDLRPYTELLPAEWRRWFPENGIDIEGTLLADKLDRAPPGWVLTAWMVLRFDTPLMGGVREQLIAKGYDGLILLDTCRGRAPNTTFVAFDQGQIFETTYRRHRLYSGSDSDEKILCGERHAPYLGPPACFSLADASAPDEGIRLKPNEIVNHNASGVCNSFMARDFTKVACPL